MDLLGVGGGVGGRAPLLIGKGGARGRGKFKSLITSIFYLERQYELTVSLV
jgi:hypothetical protein